MKPDNTNILKSAVKHLADGGILIYPTETMYGMAVDAQNENAIRRLFEIKKRNLTKVVPVLVPNRKTLDTYCDDISSEATILMEHFWPGPLTIILKSDSFPKGVLSEGKVGFRISSHPLAQALLSYFGKCMTATSANISDQPTPSDAKDFFRIFPRDSFMLIEDEKPLKPGKPSTVIDCTSPHYKIIREGAIDRVQIDKVLKEHTR